MIYKIAKVIVSTILILIMNSLPIYAVSPGKYLVANTTIDSSALTSRVADDNTKGSGNRRKAQESLTAPTPRPIEGPLYCYKWVWHEQEREYVYSRVPCPRNKRNINNELRR